MNTFLPAITVRQPWASLIAIGAKKFETRTQPPPRKYIGQRIAIHAAQRPVYSRDDMVRDGWEWRDIVAFRDAFGSESAWGDCPRGAVICTAVVRGAYQISGGDEDTVWFFTDSFKPPSPPLICMQPDSFGDYSPGRWAWLLEDVRPLAVPEAAKGKQGWWKWEPRCPHGGTPAADCATEGSCGCTIGVPAFGDAAGRLLDGAEHNEFPEVTP